MNQILYTENQKKSGTLDIKIVLRIFAIACIIFGICLSGVGIAGMFNQKGEAKGSIPTINVVSSELTGELTVKVTHDKVIDKITYSWNNERETILQGKGRTNITETIDIPVGTNVLLLKVIDIEGKETTYNSTYELANLDRTKPEIELLVEDQKVKIVAKDETELDYIAYYWNSEDKTEISARENSPKQIEQKVNILKGKNTLTVVAVDKAGNEKQVEQTYVGATKPKLEVIENEDSITIKASDEEEIKKIDIVQNNIEYSTDAGDTGASLKVKDVEFTQPLSEGRNNIKITVYNINGLYTEYTNEIIR